MSAPALLLDTNVWVDYELPRDNYEEVRLFLATALRNDARLGIAPHSLKDVFTIIERRIKQAEHADGAMKESRVGPVARAAAWAAVNHILERAEVVGSDYMDAYLASKDRIFHDFFEDNLVLAAARRMGADLLVSNDASLLKHAPLPALDVKSATQWLEQHPSMPAGETGCDSKELTYDELRELAWNDRLQERGLL